MMDKELKKRWLTALRSGEYKQGQGWLCTTSEKGAAEYCCLGVLSELVYGKDAWEQLFGNTHLTMPLSGAALPLHKDMKRWGVFDKNGESSLPGMNDGSSMEFSGNPQTFEQIADWIEKNL